MLQLSVRLGDTTLFVVADRKLKISSTDLVV
jgi:hypothetical protein